MMRFAHITIWSWILTRLAFTDYSVHRGHPLLIPAPADLPRRRTLLHAGRRDRRATDGIPAHAGQSETHPPWPAEELAGCLEFAVLYQRSITTCRAGLALVTSEPSRAMPRRRLATDDRGQSACASARDSQETCYRGDRTRRDRS